MSVNRAGLESPPDDDRHHATAVAESRARELAQLVSCTVGERLVVGEWLDLLDQPTVNVDAEFERIDAVIALLGQRHRLAVAPATDDGSPPEWHELAPTVAARGAA